MCMEGSDVCLEAAVEYFLCRVAFFLSFKAETEDSFVLFVFLICCPLIVDINQPIIVKIYEFNRLQLEYFICQPVCQRMVRRDSHSPCFCVEVACEAFPER